MKEVFSFLYPIKIFEYAFQKSKIEASDITSAPDMKGKRRFYKIYIKPVIF